MPLRYSAGVTPIWRMKARRRTSASAKPHRAATCSGYRLHLPAWRERGHACSLDPGAGSSRLRRETIWRNAGLSSTAERGWPRCDRGRDWPLPSAGFPEARIGPGRSLAFAAKLQLPAGTLEEHDELARNPHGHIASEVFLDKGESEIQPGGDAGGGANLPSLTWMASSSTSTSGYRSASCRATAQCVVTRRPSATRLRRAESATANRSEAPGSWRGSPQPIEKAGA